MRIGFDKVVWITQFRNFAVTFARKLSNALQRIIHYLAVSSQNLRLNDVTEKAVLIQKLSLSAKSVRRRQKE